MKSRLTDAPQFLWRDLDSVIRRDSTGRGVCALSIGESSLRGAAIDLASRGQAVCIVTGFCIVGADPPVAETDGPPGALALARVLLALGCDVRLLTDRYGLHVLCAAADACQLPRELVVEFPFTDVDHWIDEFWETDFAKHLTHLIAVERVGPSHTLHSVGAQKANSPETIAAFEREVPPLARNVCHNMRGIDIDNYTAPVHRLFESIPTGRSSVATIGIGDGGNEIGMGSIPWNMLREAVGAERSRIPCRVPCDHLILAGISNWGAYALAGAVAALRGNLAPITRWQTDDERRLIEALVQQGGAVDGVTARREASVDGLPLDDYLQTFDQIRAMVLG